MEFLIGLGVAGALLCFAVCVFIYIYSLCAVGRMAEKRGRSIAWWVIFSFFTTPLIGVLLLVCFGETDEQEDQRIYQEEKIREKVRKGQSID